MGKNTDNMKRRDFVNALAATGVLSGLGITAKAANGTAKVGVLIPQSGPAGLFGPSSENVTQMAVAEINSRGGIAGARVEALFADVGVPPAEATQAAMRLVLSERVDALIGMHDSAVRNAIIGALNGRVPYIYTPTYEGGECSPGVYVVGETPTQQLAPAIPWLAERAGANRWYLIGNDYVWPRKSNEAAKRYIANSLGTVVGEEYLPFDVDQFDASVSKIRDSGANGVVVTLVGGASVGFNRTFAGFGLDRSAVRLGPLVEENTLAGIGAENSSGLYVAAGYFDGLDTDANKSFRTRYYSQFGNDAAVLNALGESVYEGFRLLEALGNRAGGLASDAVASVAEGTQFQGPRGLATLRSRHVSRNIFMAEAEGARFVIRDTFTNVSSGESCAS